MANKAPNLEYRPQFNNLVLFYPDGKVEVFYTLSHNYLFALVTNPTEPKSYWSLFAYFKTRENIADFMTMIQREYSDDTDMLEYWERAQVVPLKLLMPDGSIVDIPEFEGSPLTHIVELEKQIRELSKS